MKEIEDYMEEPDDKLLRILRNVNAGMSLYNAGSHATENWGNSQRQQFVQHLRNGDDENTAIYKVNP